MTGSWGEVLKAIHSGAEEVRCLSDRCVAVQGDSRAVLSRIPAAAVDCTITSPPYGDQKNYGTPGEVGWGHENHDHYLTDLKSIFSEIYRVSRQGAAFWLVLDLIKRGGDSIPLPWQAISLAQDIGWSFQDLVIWDKGRSLPWTHPGRFRNVCEYVVLLSKGPLKHFDVDAARQQDDLSPYWIKYPERYHPAGKSPTDLWHYPIPIQGSWSTADVRHLCPFPVGLVARMITLTTAPGDVVLDPFAGSGVVAAVSDQLERRSVAVEFSPQYFEQIVSSGYAALKRRAAAELVNSPDGSGLAELNGLLRMTKYPKTLFSQLTRPDRLGDEVRSWTAALIVNADTSLNCGQRRGVDVRLLLNSGAPATAIEEAVKKVVVVPPLSKFGLSVRPSVVPFDGWMEAGYFGQREEPWFRYNAGQVSQYREEISGEQVASQVANASFDRKTRVPPIFSHIRLSIAPGIDD